MRVRVGCEFDLESDGRVPLLMMVEPRPQPSIRIVSSSRELQPAVPIRGYRDDFGNQVWRMTMPGGRLIARYDAVVEMPRRPDPMPLDRSLAPVEDLPSETLVYLLPTRAIQSDLLVEKAW